MASLDTTHIVEKNEKLIAFLSFFLFFYTKYDRSGNITSFFPAEISDGAFELLQLSSSTSEYARSSSDKIKALADEIFKERLYLEGQLIIISFPDSDYVYLPISISY